MIQIQKMLKTHHNSMIGYVINMLITDHAKYIAKKMDALHSNQRKAQNSTHRYSYVWWWCIRYCYTHEKV